MKRSARWINSASVAPWAGTRGMWDKLPSPTASKKKQFPWKRKKRLDQRMASAVREPQLCRCTPLLVARILDTALVLGLHVVQGSTLNFLLIWYEHKNGTYFWFVADLCVIMVTMGALLTSYHHVRLKTRRKIQPMGLTGIEVSQKIQLQRIPRYGAIPFSYCAWFLYSVFLVAKLGVIHQSGLGASVKPGDSHSPQMICSVLSISAVLFFLQLNTCHNAEAGSTRYLALMGSAFATAIEILDSINLYALLLGQRFEMPSNLEAAILILSSVNIVLPTLLLFRFSLSDFEEHSASPAIDFTHSTIKTYAVDVPFLVIRIYLWTICREVDVTPFLLKNALYILSWLRYTLPEGIRILQRLLDEVEEPKRTYTITVQPVVSVSPDSMNTINRQMQSYEMNTIS